MNDIHEFYFCQTDRLKNSNGSTKSKSTMEHLRLFGLLINSGSKQNRTKLMITFFKKSDAVYSGSNHSILWLIRIEPTTSPGGKFGSVTFARLEKQ